MSSRRPVIPATAVARSLRAAALPRPGDLPELGLRAAVFAAVISGAALLFAVSLAPTAGVAARVLGTFDEGLFDFPPLPEELGEPNERSAVLARDGTVLATLQVENRKVVGLDAVPEHVQHAVLATEDAAFYEHRGVNWRAITRATLGNVRAGEVTSGASTITQQLVKNVVTGADQTISRKVREAVYAIELEQRLSKREILQAYLNEAYFANGVYGIGTAAEFYWGKEVGELTVDEGAILAGMIRAPERNDPRDNAENARRRRDIVLSQMVKEGWLDADEAQRAQARPIRVDIHALEQARNPFFVDYVRHLLERDPALGENRIARQRAILRGGLTIHTTLDPRLQDLAHEVIAEVLDEPGKKLAALTAVDPRNGELLALDFGPTPYGKGPGQTEVNPAVPGLGSSGRPAGSSFKTFEIVAALEAGIPPSYTFEAGSRYTYKDPSCQGHTVGNYADASQGLLDMTAATAVSSNTYFAHLVDLTGPAALAEVANRMGITTPLQPYCSLVLGAQEVFPLDMAAAFGTLANEGRHCPTSAISRVVDRRGRTLLRGGGECEQVLDKGIAARATALLRGPIERGTASRFGRIDRPAAGKTGTGQDYRDAWFVGYVPQLSAAVWVGHDRPSRMTDPRCRAGVTGGCLPTMIWQRFMSRALDVLDLPVRQFPVPPPVPTAAVPSVVGMSEPAALAALEDAGFRAVVEVVEHWRPEGTVAAQNPGGGSRAPAGGAVVLSVSDGKGVRPVVPDLMGLTEDDARERLVDLGLALEVTRVPVERAERYGLVVGQSPPAGADATELDSVSVQVGRERTADDPTPTPSPTPTGADASPTPSPSPSPTPSPAPSPTPTELEPSSQPRRPSNEPPGQGRGA